MALLFLSCPLITKTSDIWKAAHNGDNDRIEQLLKDGVGVVNARCSTDFMQGVPLYYAAQRGHASTLQLLLSRGENIDRDGIVALQCAVFAGQEEAAEFLLNNGTRLNAINSGHFNPLHYAVWEQKGNKLVPMILAYAQRSGCLNRLLSQESTDIRSTDSESGGFGIYGEPKTPLGIAQIEGNQAMIELLSDPQKIDEAIQRYRIERDKKILQEMLDRNGITTVQYLNLRK